MLTLLKLNPNKDVGDNLLMSANGLQTSPPQVGSEGPSKARSLRRTVSVPSEGQFPEFPAESPAVLGKLWPFWVVAGPRADPALYRPRAAAPPSSGLF